MSFVETFNQLPGSKSTLLQKFESLIGDISDEQLEIIAQESHKITMRNFGRVMRLFAPLYLSNECVNNCSYCGFSRDNRILRTTLTVEQVVTEAKHLHSLGFRNILLVAGEHPKFVSEGYLQECIDAIKQFIPTIGIEVGPMEDDQYEEISGKGAEGLIVYQETYNREVYKTLHTAGPKKNFDWRLECPERAYRGGFRRIGIGALFGLAPWKEEAVSLAAHLEYLMRHCWRATFSVAFPRMRPYAGNYEYQPDPNLFLSDRSLVQLIAAFRTCFPQVQIVMSTRESAVLRDKCISLGITHMSAGSQTEPGGYTGAGNDDLHLTVKGRREELASSCSQKKATEQFTIDDQRSPLEISQVLKAAKYEPVWKDWDEVILNEPSK